MINKWKLVYDSIDAKGFIPYIVNKETNETLSLQDGKRYIYNQIFDQELNDSLIAEFKEKFNIKQDKWEGFLMYTGILANSPNCPLCKAEMQEWTSEQRRIVKKELKQKRFSKVKKRDEILNSK